MSNAKVLLFGCGLNKGLAMSQHQISSLAKGVKLALIGAVLSVPISYAQEAQPEPEETQEKSVKEKQQELEVIEVKGFAASLQRNLNIKRYADVVMDAISAEDIGKFPDQNVADALARVSGVQVESNFGEAESVSIRGTAPGLNRTLLNGQNVATSDWNALSLGKREFNYTLIPSVMVKQLEVHKTPTADIDEGSIGGTVMMKTRRPLDMEANSGAFALKGQYNDKSEEWDPQIEALYSFKSEDESWGVLATLAKQDNQVRRDALQTYTWAQGNIGGRENVWYPSLVGSDHFTQSRERQSGMITLQWAPDDRLNTVFNALYSKMDANNVSQAFYAMAGQSIALGAEPQNVVFDDVNGDTVLGMIVPEVESGSPSEDAEVQFDTRNRKAFFKTEHYDFKVEYQGDNFTVEGQLGYTEANGGNRLEFATAFFADTAIAIDNTQGIPQVELLDMEVGDVDDFRLRLMSLYDRPQHDDELYGQVDFEYLLSGDFFTSIKVGGKYRDHIKSQRANLYGSKTVTEGYDQSYYDELVVDGETTLGDFDAGPAPDNFMEDSRLPGSITDFHFLDFDALEAEFLANRDRFNIIPLLTAEFDIVEQIGAGYVRADFSYEELRGNIGVRYVRTNLDSSSWTYYGPYLDPAEKRWETHSKTYNDILPSLNLAYNVSEEVVLRFSAAKVMSRPGYGNLSGYRGLNESQLTGVGGNPDLDPYRATQYDLSWEWYINNSGGFNAAVFYKNIESYLTSTEVEEVHFHQPSNANQTYLINLKSNGSGGKNVGFELNYQQDLFYGFGINTNYTYSNSSTESGDIIPGNSEDTFNFTVYYEDGPISTRIAYNYRSEYFLFNSRGNDVYVDGSERYDATFSYRIGDNTSIVLQGINLTNEVQSRYAGEYYRHLGTYENGRKFRAGIRIKF